MRFLLAIFSLLFLIPQTAAAQVADKQKVQEASVVFWKFASCVAERDPDGVRKMLAATNWQAHDVSLAQSMAQRSIDQFPLREEPCGLFEELKFDSSMFRGALAGAMFVQDTDRNPLPDYGAVQIPVTSDDLAAATDAASQVQLGLRAFSYCVFANRPSDVRALLLSRPFSQAEGKLFDALAPTFGGCFPAQEGTRISFTHIKLRSLLGEAAYYAHSNLSARAPAGKAK